MRDIYLELPVVSYKYPEKVYKLAKRAGVKPEEIAERDGIDPDPITQISHWRFDLVLQILTIDQDPDDKNKSFVNFSTGGFDIVALNHRKLATRITNFFNKNGIQFSFTIPTNQYHTETPGNDIED